MQRLATRISRELKTARQCGVYENELSRVWPKHDAARQAAIDKFALEHGWRVRFYQDGLCAIFDKAPESPSLHGKSFSPAGT